MKPVSIIVIVYNEENNISHCIDAILNQTYSNFELIIVNDGSTDRTEDVIKLFKDNRILYAKHPHNKGYASARNTGLKLAKGDYVFFTDADCTPRKDWIKKGLKFMETNPQLVAASGITKNYCTQRKKGSLIDGASYTKGVIKYIYDFPSTMNCVCKRKVLNQIGGFDERYNLGGEDADFGLQVMKRGKTSICKDMIVFHRAKEMSLRRGLSLIKRQGYKVCLVKDHSKDYPKLRRSEVCYGFVVAPSYFLPLLFPPLIFLAVNTKNKKVTSLKDVAFLIPFYLSLWYIRLIIWKTAFKERIFLI